ncbi:autotransporter outer membrane beta-barrel domain-containing protein [Microvirga antarctica]|uniref:autotransporter outer membrane beta-barrel domain-containing protein n=1 Tax=Microvirga antarctica TaxID=2819233 RepID=UPI001B3150DD|nr:autotransporter outer membrane beta-barrel domain-containing protein [Microvirga antarctica]
MKVLTDKDKSWASRIGQSVGTLAGGVVLTKFKDLVKKEYAGKKIEKVPEVEFTVAVGGAGGKGGKGRDVTVWNEGSVITHADNSWALFAQSVGGGGGAAGAGLSTGNNKVNLNLSIGGSGGDGGDGGSVEIAQRGTIATSGAGAFGVLAQSVGGGGGIGGVATSANTVSLSGNIKVGGSGGKPSSGGRAAVDNSGTITTQGRDAHALVAQSVGGGGGVSFVTRVDPADPTVLAKSTNEKEALEAAFGFLKNIGMIEGGSILDKSTSIMAMPSLTIGFGGSGGGGGDGGDVTVTHSGEIITRGPGAFGIFAQSVGGGGGFGVDASKIGYVEAGLSLGGGNGVGGKGGNIQVNLERKSSITTSGEGATAIFLQSIGGGGGYGGTGAFKMPFNMPLVRDEATSGNAGRWIRLEMDKDDPSSTIAITTNGSRAHGIQAQSIGGGGGIVFDVNGKAFTTPASGQSRRRAMGEGGGIFVSTRGSIEASGAGSYGFYGQSGVQLTDGTLDPSRKGNAISFHHDGKLVGGAGTGAAIRIDGGNNENEVVVKANSRVSAISGTAILGSFGRETVLNDGTIVGDLDLVHGNPAAIEENRFFNRALGTYQTGPKGSVNVGTMGFFLNDGAFDVGGTGLIAASTLTGHFDQRATGTLVVDVTSSPPAGRERSDLLTITGATRLGGRVMAHVVGDLRPETFTVLSAKSDFSSTATGAGNPAAPFTWEAGVRGKTVTVTPSASFGVPAGASTTSSERNAMEYLQRIWTSGAMTDADARRFGDFARVASVQDYLSAVDKYSPEESASTTTMQALAARDSMHFALSCPVFAGTGTLMEETSCAWARMIGNWTHQNSSEDGAGYRRDSVTLRAGLQREIAPDWFLGATAGFTQSSLADSDGFSNTEGNAGDLAISLKRQVGPWLLAASGHVGYGRYETQRILGLGSSTGTSQGTSSVMTAAGRFRASYEFTFPTWYVKPYADLDVIHTSLPGHTESGLGASLAFSSAQQWNVAVSPNIEFGARLDVAPDMWLRPYASVGMTVLAKDSLPVKLRFSDTNAAVSPFVADVAIPDILGNLTVGAQLFNTKGYEIKAEYRADFGRDYLSQEVSARLAIPF